MRKTMTRGTNFIALNNEIIGISLGFDFVSEHEWGIKGLRRSLGMQDTQETLFGFGKSKPLLGIDSRRIHTLNPQHLLYHETLDGEAYLVYAPWAANSYSNKSMEEILESIIKRELTFSSWHDQTLIAAWSDKDFGIRVKGNENIENLCKIRDALLTNNAIVTLAHTKYPEIFPDGGLYVFIGNKFPAHVDEAMKADDQDKLNLQAAHKKLGLEKELIDKGKRFFALRPKWLKDFNSKVETEYDIIYWLNPMEQDRNNSGWFTVEQLRLWPEGKGPVPRKNNK